MRFLGFLLIKINIEIVKEKENENDEKKNLGYSMRFFESGASGFHF
jgi:hypothetical protein